MPSRRSQRGFTMALALALAVVMGLMLMKSGPNMIAEVQRENEAELIFRGEAMATALRIYFAKAGRYPTDLDELMKVRPRILRQKYKDPMTADGQWELITQVQPGASGNKDGLPIVGVRSHSMLDSFRIYQNKTLVHDWIFTADQNLLGVAPVVDDEKVRSLLKGTVSKGTTDAATTTATKP
ncbi:type II secretion system protein [Geothrix sp. 21YS21S-4]|uniref:type II secretion system protein n=1 Tax=Geothrix sp. 21YS21S-4 TaxID=3068889 RepID=UPI0027BA4E94|nr:type II secretion system protein [Geothrix sp. 21YS21S-4]